MKEPIKKMPAELKRKLTKLNKLIISASCLDSEIQDDLKKAHVPYGNLVAVASNGPVTEALAYINNAECADPEELKKSLDEISEVYLHFANLSIEEE